VQLWLQITLEFVAFFFVFAFELAL
jgi:hypothetical protein